MKKSLVIILLLTLFINCSKEQKLKNSFENKIWIVDSFKSKLSDKLAGNTGSLRSWNNILKPVRDSIFDVYKDQTSMFESYRISGDTLFLNRHNKSIPYKFQKYDDYTSKLVCLDNKGDYYNIYITDLTDLFSEKVKNNSALYSNLENITWYPIQLEEQGKIVIDEANPEYYTKENAFKINKDRFEYSMIFPKNAIVKLTNRGIYFFDTDKKELLDVYTVELKGNYLILRENNAYLAMFKLKKIDSSILIDTKDLPKKVRLGCNEFSAKNMIEKTVAQYSNSYSYYDTNTINLVDKNEDKCEYTYTIIKKSRDYSDIYSTKRILVYFTEDGHIGLKEIR